MLRACTALAVTVLLVACGANEAGGANGASDRPAANATNGAAEAPAVPEGRAVRVIRPETGVLEAGRTTTATVRAEQDATVASAANGRVVDVAARAGTHVEEGALVLRLDDAAARLNLQNADIMVRQARIDLDRARSSSDEGVGQAEAALRAAEANVRNLRNQVEEVRELVAIGGAARTDLASLEAQLVQAESQRVQAQDAVARAGRSDGEDLALLQLVLEQAQVQRRQAQQAVDDARVTAPFAGRVAELYLEAGEFAGAGQPAFRLLSDDRLEADVDVPPADADHLLTGGAFDLRYGARSVCAEVTGSARRAEQPRLVRVTLRIDPGDEGPIPVGALLDLSYRVRLAEGYLVPSGAISAEAGTTWVHTVASGVAVREPVEVLAESGATAAVASLPDDAVVIHPRPLDVREGTRVRAQE
ncbi:MAG: HlyD family efflux transporter periplasmic adaptor subunit [Trueperaceae bacterium]